MKVFDLHCDTLFRGVDENLLLTDKRLQVNYFCDKFEQYTQTFAAYIKDDTRDGFGDFCKMYDYMKSNGIDPVTKVSDLDSKRNALFTVENGKALNGDINNIEFLYNCGARAMTLVWNGSNRLGSGSQSVGGLTDFGRRVIEKMNGLSMAVDLSHINGEGFDEAIEIAKYPIATHSCFYSVCKHARNLTDDRAINIGKKGGIIGICVYPEFVGDGDIFEGVLRQVKHGIELGLDNNLALGTDFDGANMDKRLDSNEKLPELYYYLADKLNGKTVVDDLFYNNAKKFFSGLLTN